MLFQWTWAAVAALGIPHAVAQSGKSSDPVQVLETRRQRASFGQNAIRGLREDLITAGLKQRASDADIYRTNGSLSLTWNDATLYSYGMASVSCALCYVKGTAYASLTIDGDLNLTKAISDFHSEFLPEVKNISTQVWNELDTWATNVYDNVTDSVENDVVQFFNDCNITDLDICWDCYAFPSLEVDLNMNLTDIPETTLKLEFDDLELYMLLGLSLEADAEYAVNLYPKTWSQPAGIEIGDQLIGIVISLQLILALDAEVDISTGVHVKFDDGLAMEIVMFGTDVSTISLTDGSFEFLPVTVNTTGVTLDATLRLGVTAGLNMSEDLGDVIKLGAGASAMVYADLAHFNTNITLPDSTELTTRDDDCIMPVIETYEFGLGAQAGAFVQFMDDTWGPTPNSSIQIFYTTLYSACAINPDSATTTSSVSIAARDDDLTTTAVSTTFTVTNVVCISSGLKNCPASLQSTIHATSTSTVTLTVSGSEQATFPATTTSGSVSTVAFGTGVQKVKASSGSPVSYVPPTTATASSSSTGGISGGINDAKTTYNGLSEENKKLVIGLCAGIGGALVAATGLGIWLCVKRRNAKKQNAVGANREDHALDTSQPFLGDSEPKPKWKQTQVSITEAGPMTPRHE